MPRNLLRLFAVLSFVALLPSAPIWAKTQPKDAGAPAVTPVEEEKSDQKVGGKSEPDASDTFKQLTLFSDVLERVRADYVDPVTDDKLIETALNGMLSSLDPHSSYLNKKSFQEMQTETKGEFGGLGMEVTMENSIVKVISPMDDTPAFKAGIQAGDLVTHIDGKLVTGMSLSDAVDKMRGAPDTKVTLTIRRGGLTGKPFDVTLTRAVIHVQSVKWEQKENIAYIRITTFNEQTQTGLNKALLEAEEKIGGKLEGYVLDLRNNPGGLLEQAVSTAGTFLEPGQQVVSTRARHKEEDQNFSAIGGDKAHGKPIVVLINGGSASASEIVAGALQDQHRAVLVGIKSFGKGSVQTIIPVAGGGAMRLTTARYYTPSGRSIQALGIEPDITVEQVKLEKLASGPGIHEADLKGALQNDTVKKKDGKDAAKDAAKDEKKVTPEATEDDLGEEGEVPVPEKGKSAKKDEKPFDYQLSRAIDLIHGLHIFQDKKG
ncbi:MAG: S41 family peptidase [Pseudomonadota bacterium]|nr:S41 family peptidase [Pseudomonadota bacterium]